MGRLLVLLTAGAGAVLLLWAVLGAWQPPSDDPARIYYENERYMLQLEQARQDAVRWAGFWDVALPLIGVLVLATLAAVLIFAFIAAWERRRPLVQLDALALPVDRRALHRGAYTQLPYAILEHRTQAAIAAGPQQPHSLSLHNAYRNDVQGAQPGQLAPAPVFSPPSIGEAAERGAFRDGKYILGYAVGDGRALTLDQADGRSLLIAGQGGSGGTTYLLGSALQEILMPPLLRGQQEPARFYLVDYHARKPGSLAERAAGLGERVIDVAYTPPELERALGAFNRECRARIGGARARYPLILLCDELSNLIDDGDYSELVKPLLLTLKHANNAYRAIGGKAIVRGHTLQASAWGNSAAVRGSFHARAGMRLDEGAAQLLGIRPALAREMISLPAGRAFVTGPGLSLTEAVASNVRGDDVGRVLDLAGYAATARTVHPVAKSATVADIPNNSESAPEPDEAPAGGVLLQGDWWAQIVPPEGNSAIAESTPENAVEGNREGKMEGSPEGNPTAVRLYCLFMAGRSLPDCIEQVYGVSSTTGGRKYQAAMQNAQALLRQEIARRRAHPTEGAPI